MNSTAIYKDDFPFWIYTFLSAAAVILLAVTVVMLVYKTPSERTKLWCLAFWTIVPALWFFYEFHSLYPDYKAEGNNNLDLFKYSQEVSGKIWAGVVALVGAIVLRKQN
jgi:hypothetical protein